MPEMQTNHSDRVYGLIFPILANAGYKSVTKPGYCPEFDQNRLPI